jgi:PIN domain nuclease of toxin-antitoxin system
VSSVVFDASAVLALLHKERGADVVEQHLPGAALLTVNYSEVLKKTIEKGGGLREAEMFIRGLELEIIPFDERLASDTALLWTEAKKVGLSMADRCCLALGRSLNRTVLTAERRWTEVEFGIKVELIR